MEILLADILQILQENGIYIDDSERDVDLEIDSLSIVSIIVSIEEHFQIYMPDHYLSDNSLKTVNDFYKCISELQNIPNAVSMKIAEW